MGRGGGWCGVRGWGRSGMWGGSEVVRGRGFGGCGDCRWGVGDGRWVVVCGWGGGECDVFFFLRGVAPTVICVFGGRGVGPVGQLCVWRQGGWLCWGVVCWEGGGWFCGGVGVGGGGGGSGGGGGVVGGGGGALVSGGSGVGGGVGGMVGGMEAGGVAGGEGGLVWRGAARSAILSGGRVVRCGRVGGVRWGAVTRSPDGDTCRRASPTTQAPPSYCFGRGGEGGGGGGGGGGGEPPLPHMATGQDVW